MATARHAWLSLHQVLTAEDGERLTLIEFDTQEQVRAWGKHAEHRKAQQEGRDLYYASTTSQICDVVRESHWER